MQILSVLKFKYEVMMKKSLALAITAFLVASCSSEPAKESIMTEIVKAAYDHIHDKSSVEERLKVLENDIQITNKYTRVIDNENYFCYEATAPFEIHSPHYANNIYNIYVKLCLIKRGNRLEANKEYMSMYWDLND